jgi:hypothetical protein
MEAVEDLAATVEWVGPAAAAEMVLLAAASRLTRPLTEDQAVLPAMVLREVMAATAETAETAVTVALSTLRLRRTSTEASVRLPAAASAAVVAQVDSQAWVDLPACRVKAVAAPEALAVHSAAVEAKGQLEVREIQARAVTAGIPDSPALTEAMVL